MMSNTLQLLVSFSLFLISSVVGAQTTDWMFSTDESGPETATAVVRDHSQGCYYVAGYFEDDITHAVTLEGGNEYHFSLSFESDDHEDIFVARLSDAGQLDWIKTFGSNEDDRALSIEVGSDGLVYVGGFLRGIASISSSIGPSMTVGSNISGEPRNPFVVAFNPSGDPVWKMSAGTSQQAAVVDIKADADGINVLTYHQSQNFVSALFSINNGHQFLIQNISYDHSLNWKMTFGSPGTSADFGNLDKQRPRLAIFDQNLYVVGWINTTGFNISGPSFTQTTTWDAISTRQLFIASFTTAGAFNWVNPIQTSPNNFHGLGLAAGCDGLYLAGSMQFGSGLQFPGLVASGSMKEEMFVAKFLCETGQTEWVEIFNSTLGNDNDIAMSIALDNSGGIIVGGFFKQKITIPGFTELSGDNMDALVFGLDVGGNATWVQPLQGEDNDGVLSIDLVEAGEVIVCGKSGKTFNGFIDSQIADGENGFVAKISYPLVGSTNCCTPLDGGTIYSDNLTVCAGQPLVIYHDLFEENRKLQYSLLGFGWVDVQPVTSNPILVANPQLGFYRVRTDFGDCGSANSNLLSPNLLASVSVSCPIDKSVSLSNTCSFTVPDYTGELVVAGACPMDIVQTPAPGTILGAGPYLISLEGMVAGLVVNSCTFNLTVQDNEMPSLACLVNINKFTANGCGYEVEDLTTIVAANDNCGIASISQSIAPGTELLNGAYTITFTAVDNTGNITTCSSSLNVSSGVNSFVCPPDQVRSANPSDCQYIVEDFKTLLVLTGYCSGTTVVQTPSAGTALNVGNHTIDFQLTDAFGVVSNCNMNLQVVDNQDPVLTGIGTQTLAIVSGCSRAIPNYTSLIGVNEACGYVLSQVPAAGTLRTAGSHNCTITCVDNSGNSSSTSFTIEVIDQIDPIVTYPSEVVVQADASCTYTIEDLTGFVNVTENCSLFTMSQFPFAGSIVGLGNTPIEIEVIDSHGNSTIANFMLKVVPNPSWTIACAADVNATAPIGTCTASVSLQAPEVSGLCVGYTISNNAPTEFPIGDTEVIWTITTDEGEVKTCPQNVFVDDVEAPQISCPSEIIIFVIAGCNWPIPNYTSLASVSNNCGNVTISQIPAAGSVLGVGQHPIQLIATDTFGNSANCTFQLQIKDNTPPSLACPTDKVRNADSNCQYTLENFTSQAITSDDCGNTVLTQSPSVGTVLPIGSHTIQISALDVSGNTSVCSFNVSVIDATAPVLDCQTDVFLTTDAGACFASHVLAQPLISEACSGFVVTNTAPSTFPIGSTVVEWSVTDIGSNSASCVTNVHVSDIVPPIFDCPSSYAATVVDCEYLVPDFTTGILVSDCQSTTISQNPIAGASLGVGVHPISITVEDIDGNTQSCSFEITVIDDQLPQITCVDDQERNGSATCGYVLEDFTASAIVSDNCGVQSVVQTPLAGTILSIGTHSVMLLVNDMNGNQSNCNFEVLVFDDEAPSVNCPDNITLTTDLDKCTALNVLTAPIASDPCGISDISNDAPIEFPVGITQVQWEITDVNGNTTTCLQTVIVEDIQEPELDCLLDISRSVGTICEYILEDFASMSSATDNCGEVTLTQNPIPGTVLMPGMHVVEVVATDEAGNEVICSFNLEVIDNSIPNIDCLENQVRSANDLCTYEVEDFTGMMAATDNCGIATIIQNPLPGTLLPPGNNAITVEFLDIHGNSSMCSFMIEVNDDTAPIVICSEDVELENDANECSASYLPLSPMVIEGCDNYVLSNDAPSHFPIGSTVVTWLVVDAFGNEGSCQQTITVADIEQPIIECLDVQTRVASDNCFHVLEDFTQIISVQENCGSVFVTQSPEAGSMLGIGGHIVEITATDLAGNESVCIFEVQITDESAPILDCPNSLTQISEACLIAVPDLSLEVEVSECSQFSFDQEPNIGNLMAPGIYPITVVVIDENGHTSTCTTSFEFQTTTTLLVECNLPSEIAVSSCSFEIPDYTEGVEILSSCGEVTFIQLPEAGTVVTTGAIEVSIQAVDAIGNTAYCFQEIGLSYFTDIIMTLQGDTTVSLENDCQTIVDYALPQINGGCGEVVVTQTMGPVVGDTIGIGSYEIGFTATDIWGNTASDTFLLTVVDTEAPLITCGASISSCDPWVVPSSPIAQDNCEVASLELAENNTWHWGESFPNGMTEVVFEATDNSGNLSVCSTLVQVNLPQEPNWNIPSTWCVGDEVVNLNDLLLNLEGFSWSGSITNEHFLNPSQIGPGNHSITLTSSSGMCSSDSTILFTVGLRPEVFAGDDFAVCGLLAEVSGTSSSDDILWTTSETGLVLNPNSETAIVEGDDFIEERFMLTGFGSFGCNATDTVVVTFVEPPSQPIFTNDQITLLLGQDLQTTFEFEGGGDLNFSWLDDVNLPIDVNGNEISATDLAEGNYEMVMWASNSPCHSESDHLRIEVLSLSIPTGFSPNGDGFNDYFEIVGISLYPNTRLQVFDRDGNLVYQTFNYDNSWDGLSLRGEILPADTYFMVVGLPTGKTLESYLIIRK